MENIIFRFIAILLFGLLTHISISQPIPYCQYVDPFIGTGGHGHTYPGATLPFGMVQLSPDTRLTGWDGCSGYHYSDSVIFGFSHTHLSGTGCSDYGDILMMPTTGDPSVKNKDYASSFSHKNEQASPGYYSVLLDKFHILAELTTTTRVGLHKYTFPATGQANIIVDLVHRDQMIASSLKVVSKTRIEGMRRSHAWATDQHIYFVAEFSKPFSSFSIAENDIFKPELKETTSNAIKAYFQFKTTEGEVIYVKVGISTVSIDGARKNLKAELKDWNFDRVKKEAEIKWDMELSKIEVLANPDQMKTFYTALYHTMVVPNINMDVDGSYRGRDNKIHIARGFTYYSVFSLWDTYRAAHPLYTIIDQKRTVDFIKTFLVQYEQGGRLPVWEFASNETDCMIGYHSISVIADAAVKGITGFDRQKAFEAMKKSATWNHLGLPSYMEHGYIDVEDESESVSKTLEYAYDDWCIAQMAKLLSRNFDYIDYTQRAQYYKNLFDPQTGFMRPKKNANWLSPFDPKEVNNNYTEANAWQYSFYVPQDISGLIKLMGGKENFAKKLDELFTTGSETSGREQVDISGLIGQYAHGNEPSHHMAYLYNFAGQPGKTQFRVHQILTEFYKPAPEGLIGNEDCGQMSAWYVLSAIGFYPVTPGLASYTIGSPLFQEVKIHFENGKTFRLKANNVGEKSFYIQTALLNGKSYNNSFLLHQNILNGDSIEFEMSDIEGVEFGIKEENIPFTSIIDHQITTVPVISASGKIFRNKTTIKITAANPDDVIYFTTDSTYPGAEYHGIFPSSEFPGLKHAQISAAFEIDTNTTIKAITKNKLGEYSKMITACFYKILGNENIKVLSKCSPQYTAGGDEALIDGIRGDVNWRKGDWQGYQGQDFEAIIDLGEIRFVGNFSAGFLQDSRSWIIFPKKVEFSISEDGIHFSDPFETSLYISADDQQVQIKDFKVQTAGLNQARYIKIKAYFYGKLPPKHLGAGNDSWIFVDEINVK